MLRYFPLCILWVACNNATPVKELDKQPVLSDLDASCSWMLGEWHQVSPAGHAVEMWQRQSDSALFGISFLLVGKDTASSETIKIVQRGEDLYFIPTVKGQNAGRPVVFKRNRLASQGKQVIVFENQQHDFPQMISYKQESPVFMTAKISGMVDGKLKEQEFPMIKK